MEDSDSEGTSIKGLEESPASLKRVCNGYTGRLQRQYNQLEVLLTNYSNRAIVAIKYDRLNVLFTAYEEKFNEYYSMLTGTDAETAIGQFENQRSNYEEFQRRITEWTQSAEKKRDTTTTQVELPGDNKCVRSSGVSVKSDDSVQSSVRLKDARIKRDLAKLKKDQLREAQKLKRVQQDLELKMDELQVEHDVSIAEAEVRLWEDGSTGESVNKDTDVKLSHVSDTLNSKLNPNANEWHGGVGHVVDEKINPEMGDSQLLYQTISTMTNMPKPELSYFTGDPIEY